MAKCDLCDAHCGAAKLVQLLDSYKVPGVVDICHDCEKWANKMKSDMLLEIAPRMRSAIAERRGVPAVVLVAHRSWWQRITGTRAAAQGDGK